MCVWVERNVSLWVQNVHWRTNDPNHTTQFYSLNNRQFNLLIALQQIIQYITMTTSICGRFVWLLLLLQERFLTALREFFVHLRVCWTWTEDFIRFAFDKERKWKWKGGQYKKEYGARQRNRKKFADLTSFQFTTKMFRFTTSFLYV